MNKYKIVMDFDIMANSPKDARNKSRTLVNMYAPPRDSKFPNRSWLLQCSILKLSVRATQHGQDVGSLDPDMRWKEIK